MHVLAKRSGLLRSKIAPGYALQKESFAQKVRPSGGAVFSNR
jgi:hypothetical protein